MRGGDARAILLVVGLLAWLNGCATAGPVQAPLWQERAGGTVAPELARLSDHLVGLAERAKPALVQISVRHSPPPAAGKEPSPHPPLPDEGRRTGGSGFVIREDGLIVTNAHVVAQAERIQVRLADGRRFDGKLVGKDSRVDLAVVQIQGARGLPVLPLGDSERVRVGEFVLALGNPFGLEQTVSFGIVGRKGAPLRFASPGFDFIQTDAAVNPGNSGGPLVNMAGEVVGVNSMAARGGSIGFAIPANLLKALLPQLVARGRVEWGWLGVAIEEIPEENAAKLGLSEVRGVLVRQVLPGAPAETAGVKPMDVILGVDSQPVAGPRDLQRIIATTQPGKTVRLRVIRERKETELAVTVGLYQEPAEGQRPAR